MNLYILFLILDLLKLPLNNVIKWSGHAEGTMQASSMFSFPCLWCLSPKANQKCNDNLSISKRNLLYLLLSIHIICLTEQKKSYLELWGKKAGWSYHWSRQVVGVHPRFECLPFVYANITVQKRTVWHIIRICKRNFVLPKCQNCPCEFVSPRDLFRRHDTNI